MLRTHACIFCRTLRRMLPLWFWEISVTRVSWIRDLFLKSPSDSGCNLEVRVTFGSCRSYVSVQYREREQRRRCQDLTRLPPWGEGAEALPDEQDSRLST